MRIVCVCIHYKRFMVFKKKKKVTHQESRNVHFYCIYWIKKAVKNSNYVKYYYNSK